MLDTIKKEIVVVLEKLGIGEVDFAVSHSELSKGDYSSNVAMVLAKNTGEKPTDLGEKLSKELEGKISGIEKIEVAGPGFLNFYISNDELIKQLTGVGSNQYGDTGLYAKQKVIVEYTDPNPFKEFHIGHLMSNAIGESISRLYESAGAEVIRVTWQGDVGMHIAMAVWAIKNGKVGNFDELQGIQERVSLLGKAYAAGSTAFKGDPAVKKEIEDINKKIYSRDDIAINKIYDTGRQWSLDYFDQIYKKLGSQFNRYFFESELGPNGLKIVKEHMGVFEESEGAVVFKGEKYGLHTRVFINSAGLPVYEAKELGLNQEKFDLYSPDLSVIITGNEINAYFKVLLKVMELIMPEVAKKTRHIGHGMMRMPTGKMSSRFGNVITGESLITGVENLVLSKLEERGLTDDEKREIVEDVAVGAIKYSILKAAPGRDINFDFEKSISFEGDSGPYMQYTAVRIKSLLAKAKEEKIEASSEKAEEPGELERMLYRFPEIVAEATKELAPQHIATYLIELSSSYNSYYASHPVIGSDFASYRLYLSKAVLNTISRGLWILGIRVPEKM